MTAITTCPPPSQPSSSVPTRPALVRDRGRLVLLCATGMLLAAMASALLTLGSRAIPPNPPRFDTATAASSDGPTVSVTDLTYEPGHSSGWHVHAGTHSVVVLSGTLTVSEEDCQPQEYRAGQTYVGGRDAHQVSNVGAEPAQLVVVYFSESTGTATPSRTVAPPEACESVA